MKNEKKVKKVKKESNCLADNIVGIYRDNALPEISLRDQQRFSKENYLSLRHKLPSV